MIFGDTEAQTAYDYSVRLFDRFEAETGRSVLSVWREYESWLEDQPDLDEYCRILETQERRKRAR